MTDTENNYTPVPDGIYECKIVFAMRADRHYGHEINGHVVYDFLLVPIDSGVENPVAYRAEFPVLIKPGYEWDYYNKQTELGEWKKATAKDMQRALDYAQKCFPDWKQYCDELDEDADQTLPWNWFLDRAYTDAVTVRAKLTNGGTYQGSDGLEHDDLKAKIYPRDEAKYVAKAAVGAEEAKNIAKTAKACGVKIFGGAAKGAKAVKATGAAPAQAPMTPKTAKATTTPPPPPKPAKTIDAWRAEAWDNYQKTHSEDKTGGDFYPLAAKVIGKGVNSSDDWSASDWRKIAETFEMPF